MNERGEALSHSLVVQLTLDLLLEIHPPPVTNSPISQPQYVQAKRFIVDMGGIPYISI